MSFFSKLFGGGKTTAKGEPKILSEEEYNGYTIAAIEMKQGSEYMLAGHIRKQIGEELKFKKFIRADRLHSAEQAAETALRKAKQIIDQEGDKLFDTPY